MKLGSSILAALAVFAFAVVAPTEASAAEPGAVTIIGGDAVIPDAAAEHLDACIDGTVSRVAGSDRYATAAALADTFDTADIVFLATGENFPDALAVGSIAAQSAAPILLTRKGSIPSVTLAAIERLSPSLVVIVGGPAAISATVESQLSDFTTTRVFGPNRYATAASLSTWFFDDPAAVDTVFVATGEGFLDALVAGPMATEAHAPVLLVGEHSVPSSTAAEIHRLGPSEIVIVGSSGVVSNGVEAELGSYASVSRVAGASRYTTAANAAAGASGDDVLLVTADNFPDGLAAAPVANGTPIVLASASKLPQATADAITARVGGDCEEWILPYPQVGSGKRVIYTLSGHQLWMIDENENLVDTYLVTGRDGIPHPGTYEVYSKSIKAYAPYGGITMSHMVRFVRPWTFGNRWAYGFHSIPRYSNGTPLMAEEDLGSYGSGGCVRQSDAKAFAMYQWADIGTTVIVLP